MSGGRVRVGFAIALSAGALLVAVASPLAQAAESSLSEFTSPIANATYIRNGDITLSLTQTSSTQSQQGSFFPAVQFTSDTGCVNSSTFDAVYAPPGSRSIVLPTEILPGAQIGPCTITATEIGGTGDTSSVTIQIGPEVAGVTVQPNQVGGNQVGGNQVAAGPLPRTGSSSLSQVWLGVALLGVGALFIGFARRARNTQPA